MMQIVVQSGFVHGEPLTSTTHTMPEDTYQERGWEACDQMIREAMDQARAMMHPGQASWVTVEWSWSQI